MIPRILPLFFFFLISSINATAQENTPLELVKMNPDTSSLRVAIRSCGQLRSSQPDSSLQILNSLLPYITASSDQQIKAEFLNENGATLNNLGRYDEAIKYLDQALEMFTELNHVKGIASSKNNKGNSLLRKGNAQEALQLFIDAEKGFLECGAIDNALSAQQAQGAVFLELSNYDMALSIFKKAEKTASENNRESTLLYILLNTGSVYYGMGNLDTAAIYYQRVGEKAKSMGVTSIEIAAYSNLASVYFEQHDLVKSIQMDEKSLALARSNGDVGMQISILNNLASSYASINNYVKANECMDEAITLGETLNSVRTLLPLTKTKADILYHSGKGSEAYELLKKHLELKDSLMNEDNQILVAEMQAEHDEFKNQMAIDSLEKSNLIADQNLKLSQAREAQFSNLLIGVGIAALILIVALLVYLNQNKKLNEKNKIIEENLNEKEMLLMEVHHRVKNNLQMIHSILNMQTRGASDEAAALLHENKDRIKSISMIHEKLYSNQDLSQKDLNDLLKDIAENAAKTSAQGSGLKLNVNCDQLKLDMDTLISIGILVNELVTNSLKYAFSNSAEKEIQINLKKTASDELDLIVKDNGKGFDDSSDLAKSGSFGYKMMTTLCKKLQGTIETKNNNGAEVKIKIRRFKTAA
jgi:two-component sensor histidine kinase